MENAIYFVLLYLALMIEIENEESEPEQEENQWHKTYHWFNSGLIEYIGVMLLFIGIANSNGPSIDPSGTPLLFARRLHLQEPLNHPHLIF